MKLIAHRGNVEGRDEVWENTPRHIDNAISMGYDVEVDVWESVESIWLGHDRPTYSIRMDFLLERAEHLWIHAKNITAVEELKSYPELNWFWHDKDDMTLTSKNIPWCYEGVYVEGGITVELGEPKEIPNKILGVCTDTPSLYERIQYV